MVDSERLTERINARIQERTAEEHAARASRAGRAPVSQTVLALAAKHGVDPSKLRHATDEEIAAHDAQVQREWNERKISIQLARMPVAFRRAELPRTDAGVIAMRWLTDYRRGLEGRRSLLVMGPTGTGKTYIAMALARLLLVEDVVPVTIVTAPDLMAALRPSTVREHADLDMMSFAITPVLVLDDLGSEKMSEWTEEQLYRLADERSRNARPTIVTSNLDGAGLRARYGDRIIGRLFGGASLIKLDGADRRALPDGF